LIFPLSIKPSSPASSSANTAWPISWHSISKSRPDSEKAKPQQHQTLSPSSLPQSFLALLCPTPPPALTNPPNSPLSKLHNHSRPGRPTLLLRPSRPPHWSRLSALEPLAALPASLEATFAGLLQDSSKGSPADILHWYLESRLIIGTGYRSGDPEKVE
jgi:hypothetical protein